MSQHLVSTPARVVACRCGAVILFGLSEGLHARVDIFPADQLTEMVALISGRWCYTLVYGFILERRVGGQRSGPVLVEHRCGEVLRSVNSSPPREMVPEPKNSPPF